MGNPAALTRADVQAIIDSQPKELSVGNPGYDAMIDDLSDLVFAVWFAATDFAGDQVGWKWITQTFYSDASFRQERRVGAARA